MAEYKSSPVAVGKSAETIYDKLTDLAGLEEAIRNIPQDKVPDDKRELLDNIRVDEDTLVIPGGPTGNVTLVKADCVRPTLVSYEGVGTPVPVMLSAHNAPTGPESSEITVEASLQVPAMLKPMLNGPMQKLVDQIADSVKSMGI